MADDASCSSCHAALLPGAPFCHNCGLPAHPATSRSVAPPGPPAAAQPERLQVVLDEPATPTPTPTPTPPPQARQPAGASTTPAPAIASVEAAPHSRLGSAAKGFLAAGAVAVAAGVGFLAYQATADEPATSASASASPAPQRDPEGASPESGEADAPAGDGSEEDFCDEVDEIATESRAQADEFAEIPEDDPLAGLAFLLRALGDIQVYMDRMVEVAPDEIRSDVEVVAETVQPVTSTDPFEIGLALIEAYTHQNSFVRVDEYTVEHCGTSLFGTQPTG